MDQNSTLSESRRAAVGYLSQIFSEIVCAEGRGLLESEDLCMREGHLLLAEALSSALERYDDLLCSKLPDGLRIHDRRRRTLATKLGDVGFSWRRCRDAAGNTVIPLADALDIPWGARISPSARAFLVEAGAEVSFAKSARLLGSAGGSSVSAASVMGALHKTGELCAREDEEAARSLYRDGVIPGAECGSREVCIEADGTWIRLQRAPEGAPRKVEIKALVSYAGKRERGSKVSRVSPVRHGCVGTPDRFWTEGIAAIGTRFDLSKIERVHFGSDGESFYKQGHAWLPISADTDTHLDPFHVSRAILSCFPASGMPLARNVAGMAADGDVASAAAVLDAAEEYGLANKRARKVADYLRRNEAMICNGGPSLGTMEAEQQHIYGCRMDSVPCGWSVAGADAMARVRSRKYSERELPHPTRSQSASPRRRARSSRRERAYLKTRIDTKVPVKVGHGSEAEHRASLANCSAEVRYAAAIDSGMVGIG